MISFVLAADGSAQELLASVSELAKLIDELEHSDLSPSVYIVPLVENVEILTELLNGVEGAAVLDPRRNIASALQSGVEVATEQLIWLGCSTRLGELAGFAESLNELRSTAYVLSGSWLLAHRSAVVAAGSPGRFAEIGKCEDLLIELCRHMPTAIASTGGSNVGSPGFAQAKIDITHPSALEVGSHSYIGMRSLIRSAHSANPIRIGRYCSMSGEVQILALRPRRHVFFDQEGERVEVGLVPQHAAETATTFPMNLVATDAPFVELRDDGSIVSDPLVIGNDVWVGWGARIVGPVVVGDGAVISAGSVVLGNVPPYSVVAGNPATVVRTRFSADTIERLMTMQWWNWPEEKVKTNWWWFTRPVKEFLDHFENEI